MRSFAKRVGYSLSEHGLSKKGENVSYNFTDERSIFQFLNMRYVRPHKRKHGGVAAAAWQRPSSTTDKIISKEKTRSKKAASSGIAHLQVKYDHCHDSDDSDFQTIVPMKKKKLKRREASLLDDHGELKDTLINTDTAVALKNSELVLEKQAPAVKNDRTTVVSSKTEEYGLRRKHFQKQKINVFNISGYKVKFPFGKKPFPSQFSVMGQTLRALHTQENALLGIPNWNRENPGTSLLQLVMATTSYEKSTNRRKKKWLRKILATLILVKR